jgi:hypothetical protein
LFSIQEDFACRTFYSFNSIQLGDRSAAVNGLAGKINYKIGLPGFEITNKSTVLLGKSGMVRGRAVKVCL